MIDSKELVSDVVKSQMQLAVDAALHIGYKDEALKFGLMDKIEDRQHEWMTQQLATLGIVPIKEETVVSIRNERYNEAHVLPWFFGKSSFALCYTIFGGALAIAIAVIGLSQLAVIPATWVSTMGAVLIPLMILGGLLFDSFERVRWNRTELKGVSGTVLEKAVSLGKLSSNVSLYMDSIVYKGETIPRHNFLVAVCGDREYFVDYWTTDPKLLIQEMPQPASLFPASTEV